MSTDDILKSRKEFATLIEGVRARAMRVFDNVATVSNAGERISKCLKFSKIDFLI